MSVTFESEMERGKDDLIRNQHAQGKTPKFQVSQISLFSQSKHVSILFDKLVFFLVACLTFLFTDYLLLTFTDYLLQECKMASPGSPCTALETMDFAYELTSGNTRVSQSKQQRPINSGDQFLSRPF